MMMMMKVEVISKEIIKPSSPTPHHLRTFNLSFLDQIAPPVYVPIILFYSMDGHDDKITTVNRCKHLKKSLSDTLNRFYPVAGRIKDDVCIECNDMGVDYFEAKVNGLLSDVIKQPNPDLLKHFLPCETYCSGSGSESGSGSGSEVLLAIQVNVFDCGGMAIGVCISHRIADVSSLTTFVNVWAATTCGSNGSVGPSFELASLFPWRDLCGFKSTTGIRREKIVTKRLVFEASTIATLRAKTSNGSRVEYPTRVEVVTAFIWKRFMDVVEAKKKPVRAYAVLHALNLRRRMVPPLPENSFGNMYSITIAPLMVEIENNDHDLVDRIRNAIREIDSGYVKKLQSGDWYLNSIKGNANKISKGDIMVLNFSSWCRFPLYEANFGWGKPIWVSTTTLPFKNVVIFMDTRSGDGIEAWVNMLEEDMAEFERDQEIFACVSSPLDA